jgi:outer membrane lipoprotein-sorting protein
MPSLVRDRRLVFIALAVVVAVVVAGGFWLLSRDRGSEEEVSNGLKSYEFEARVEVETDRNEADDGLDTIRGWSVAKDRWRWEFSTSDPTRVEEGSIQVSDGKSVWSYDRPTNLYYQQRLEEYQGSQPPELGEGPTSLFLSLMIGPVPPNVAEAFAVSDPIGREEVAGRPARILQSTHGDPERESKTTVWVDEELPFVLKFTATNAAGSGSATATVVSVSFNDRLDADLFRFKAPPGAKEVQAPSAGSVSENCGSSSSAPVFSNWVCSSTDVQTGPSRTLSVPPGFLRPGYVPAGFRPRETHTSSGPSGMTFVRLGFESGAGGYVTLEQQMRAGGLAESHRQGRQVDVDGGDGYETNAGTERRLVWAQGDMVLRLLSDVLPLQELVRIAESLR